jgi:hypothetical protein
MKTSCTRCAVAADAFMSYDYSGQQIWLDDLFHPPEPNTGYPLCGRHAGRLTPPVGWTLSDRRAQTRPLLAARDVA